MHAKYVFAPADKAANNIIIICTYYLSVIVRELGLLDSNVCSTTNGNMDKSVNEIVYSQLEFAIHWER